MQSQLEKALRQPRTVNALRERLSNAVEALSSRDPPPLDHVDRTEQIRGELACQTDFENLIAEFGLSCPCTVDDLVETALRHLPYGEGDGFDSAYERFVVDTVADTRSYRSSERFALCPSKFWHYWPLQPDDCGSVWTGPGLSLEYDGFTTEMSNDIQRDWIPDWWMTICQTPEFKHPAIFPEDLINPLVLWGRLKGHFSHRAIEQHALHVKRIVGSTVKSWAVLSSSCDEFFGGDQNDVPGVIRLLRKCLDACYCEPKKKSLEARLRNAVELIKEADGQQDRAISLALSFAAIEALTCTKQDGITDELSRNVATLLLHDPLLRPQGIDCMKKLYKERSKLLHGEELHVSADSSAAVRTIAAQVMLAVCEWDAHMRRMGEVQRMDGFIKELQQAHMTGKRMVGVPEVTSRFFGKYAFGTLPG